MEKIKPRTLSGFMELLPERQLQMEQFLQTLRDTYARYGFTPLDTPVVEAAEVLLAKGGGDTEKQIYRFQKGDSDLALRFDLTVPLAKYVAMNYGQLAFPFRRYQIGKVYRGERAQRGRFREFYQADIDVIGDGELSILNDAEMPAIICSLFRSLGLTRFQIHFNNRKVLNGFFAMRGIPAALRGEALRIIDKLDKIGAEAVNEMLAQAGLNNDAVAWINELLANNAGSTADKLAWLERLRGRDETFDLGLDELRAVADSLADFGVPAANAVVDLTIARGLDYYTGTVYETLLLDHPEIGSICSGGRYDNLAEYYTDKKLPGVGISIGLTRLFFVLEDEGLLSAEMPAPIDALVIPMTEDLAPAIQAATALRAAGVRTQIYGERKKFKAKMGYADKLRAPFAVLLGEDEIRAGTVSVKDMRAGTQEQLAPEAAAARIAAALRDAPRHPLIAE